MLLAVSRAETEYSDMIVTMRPGQSIRSINEENGTQTLRQIPNTSIYLIRLNEKDEGDRVLRKIRRNAEVESAENNSVIALTSTDVPVSASADLGHAMADLLEGRALTTFYGVSVLQAYAEQPALDVIRVREVRSLSTGAGTRVAFIDTGVDLLHPALQPWLEPGLDLVNGSSASELDGLGHGMSDLLDHSMTDLLDDRFFFILNSSLSSLLNGSSDNSTIPPAFGHGTMVAGLIHVVAPQATIIPIKAFDVYGQTTLFRLIEGVYAAIESNADVLNMSFSTTMNSNTLQRSLDKAQAAGIALVAAVGNDGQDVRDRYPAAYATVLGVAATDLDDRLTSFSNYGRNVSVTAPGAFVVSTAPGGKYAIAWGTSFSAPIVAGGIAILSSEPNRGQANGSLIVTTADSIDAMNPGLETKLGKGRINLRQAFRVKE